MSLGVGICIGIGTCNQANGTPPNPCRPIGDEFLYNYTFDCGTDGWGFEPTYPATITDNGDGSVHLKADSNFGSLVPNEDTFPSATWVLECKVRNVAGNGKLSFRRPNGTWVTNTTYNTDGTFSAQFTGAIAEIHVGANGDDTFEADYDYISLKHYVPPVPNAFDILVHSPAEPSVKDVLGGTITVTDNGDGTWQLASTDAITTFQMDANRGYITKIEVIAEELTSLNYTFNGCQNMVDFVAPSTAFSGITNFSYAWHNCTKLTSFPMIDTSEGTDFVSTWDNCRKLTSFPLLDTSKGTDFRHAWEHCSKLTSFPTIDTSKVTDFSNAWQYCAGLTSFPLLDISEGTNFSYAWEGCSELTSFPLLDTSKGTDFRRTWSGCIGLTSFPLLDTSKGIDFDSAWSSCNQLTSFPLLDTSKGTNFRYAWGVCSKLKCMQRVDTTSATNVADMFKDCPALCRPNASERTQIEQTPGINWVTDVPDGEDCCSIVFSGNQVVYNGEDVVL